MTDKVTGADSATLTAEPLALRFNDQLGLCLAAAMDVYWCTAYAEGQTNATHDTPDGAAQRAVQALHASILADRRAAVSAERERWALWVRAMHKADDAYGTGFYQQAEWLAAYEELRRMAGLSERAQRGANRPWPQQEQR